MTNTEILNNINREIKTLTKSFTQHTTGRPTDFRRDWMTTVEVSHALGISAKTIQRLRNCGSLPFSRVRGKIYFKRSDVEALLENNYQKSNNPCGCR